MNKKIFEMTSEEFEDFMNSEEGSEFTEGLEKAMNKLEKRKEKEREITKSKDYVEWLVDFVNRCTDKTYSSEYFLYHKNLFTETDIENEKLLDFFFDFLYAQGVVNDCALDEWYEDYLAYFCFNKRLYQYRLVVGQGALVTIRDVTEFNEEENFEEDYTVLNLDKYFGGNDDQLLQEVYKEIL